VNESGWLVPGELVVELIRERLSASDTAHGLILDGLPRTFVQAAALDAMLREIDKQLDLVLELQVPHEIAAERLSKRAALERRPDDTPEEIRRRLALYHEETEPLVEYYRSRGNVVGIHGHRSENEVFAEIQQALEQAGAVA